MSQVWHKLKPPKNPNNSLLSESEGKHLNVILICGLMAQLTKINISQYEKLHHDHNFGHIAQL